MNLFANIRVALRALAVNKLRSILTMLGIIIGVGAVVSLMAIGNGATASITEQIEGIGTNNIQLFPGKFERGGQRISAKLTFDDYKALDEKLEKVRVMAPTIQRVLQLKYIGNTVDVEVIGTLPAYQQVRSMTLSQGRFFSDGENGARSRVVVLGSQTAADLFGGLNPIGRTVKIDKIFFEVIGVLESKGGSGFGSEDEVALVPMETGYTSLLGNRVISNGIRTLSSVTLSAMTSDDVEWVMVQIERIMRQQHGLKLSDELDFTVFSQNAFLEAFDEITAILTTFLGAIAGISLLVGGIGIM
ncbi:MAG TPA: hypothetical protein DGM69_06250, partial [Chloroflexi bacterium]|nr:hypothetical protein [Chloroflexota bacterium]